jgi:hypothetical protein
VNWADQLDQLVRRILVRRINDEEAFGNFTFLRAGFRAGGEFGARVVFRFGNVWNVRRLFANAAASMGGQ